MSLCKYKNALGKPKEGIHKYRIFNIAIVDLILTIILSVVISKIFRIKLWISFFEYFVCCLISFDKVAQFFCFKNNTFKA